jgi:hypothetical protein
VSLLIDGLAVVGVVVAAALVAAYVRFAERN